MAGVTVSVRRTDKGLKKFMARVARLAHGKAVTVGVHGDSGGTSSGRSVAEIAAIHEFGLGVPQRSWLRAWVEEQQSQINAMIVRVAGAVAMGKTPELIALQKLGALFVGQIQKRISGSIPPPNAPSTIARKNSSTTLIDTGVFRASITFKVE